MSRIKVEQTIGVYEIDGEEVPIGTTETMGVNSHWNWNERVVLKIGKHSYTVVGYDLIEAIHNAMNTE